MTDRPRRRVRFVKAELERLPNGHSRAFVELMRDSGEIYVGAAEGGSSESETLHSIAIATADAVHQVMGGIEDTLVIKGMVILKSFGKSAVVVSVSVRYESENGDLQGFCISRGDPSRAAALAVLNGTNRFLGLG
jgi:imidazole glycerol phosphate synthase subunit HisF